jgi:hypothetical protein
MGQLILWAGLIGLALLCPWLWLVYLVVIGFALAADAD